MPSPGGCASPGLGRSAIPPGLGGFMGSGSGRIAALNHRLISATPPGSILRLRSLRGHRSVLERQAGSPSRLHPETKPGAWRTGARQEPIIVFGSRQIRSFHHQTRFHPLEVDVMPQGRRRPERRRMMLLLCGHWAFSQPRLGVTLGRREGRSFGIDCTWSPGQFLLLQTCSGRDRARHPRPHSTRPPHRSPRRQRGFSSPVRTA